MKIIFAVVIGLVTIALLSGCIDYIIPQGNITTNTLYEYVKANDEPITLINYRNATDSTWNELITFLQNDSTDTYTYDDDTFICGDFAEMLHNNAEKEGIKSGVVFIDFSNPPPIKKYEIPDFTFRDAIPYPFTYTRGDCYWSESAWTFSLNTEKEKIIKEFNKQSEYDHMINVFNTSDKGIVYVDATGLTLIEKEESEWKESNDVVVYILEGHRYGAISINKAVSPQYEYYENYEEELIDYLARCNRYEFYFDKYERCMGNWNDVGYMYGSDGDYDNIVIFNDALSEYLDVEWVYINSSNLSEYYYEPSGEVLGVEVIW